MNLERWERGQATAAIVRNAGAGDNHPVARIVCFTEFVMWRWWILALVVGLVTAVVAAYWLDWLRLGGTGPQPQPVPSGDREIAWLHIPTSFESWENFVWGVKRAEMAADGAPSGLEVDDSAAFPSRTTAVPEVVVRRRGYSGSLRIRWYKLTDEATQEAWVNALAARDPAPLAVIGGWSSDRARELADAIRGANWPGIKPLLFLTQATADVVDAEDGSQSSGPAPSLISVYDRSFRFCFTNQQMADAVTGFVLTEPSLRPGPVAPPGLHALPAMAAGSWTGLTTLATETLADPAPVQAFAIQWNDDPYSTDLSWKFRESLKQQATKPRLQVDRFQVPFSTGRLNRPNRAEAEAAEHILASLPPVGTRSILVIPTVSAPARRTVRTLVQGEPAVGQRLVVMTGDGLSVNTLFRDREYAWPVRSLPVPFVLFTHADPFGWDNPGYGPPPPPGYELLAPRPGEARTTTEDIRLFTRLAGIVAAGFFPDGQQEIAATADDVAARLRALNPPCFDVTGNRRSDTGEHVVVLRPAFPGDITGRPRIDATLEVYTRLPGQPRWSRVHALPLGRSHGSQPQ